MGMPSIGIYSYELYNFYGVENIIRIGSAGAMTDKLHLRDIVAGMSAYTNSNYGASFGFSGHLAPCCSYELLTKAVEAGKALGQPIVPAPSSPRIASTSRAATRPLPLSSPNWAFCAWRWRRRRSI